MTREGAKGNLIHAIRWNDMPKKEALEVAIKALEQEPCEDAIRREDALRAFMYATNGERLPDYDCDNYPVTYDLRCIKKTLRALPSVNPQPKTGHWIYKIYGGFHEQGDWYCSHCDYQFNYGNGHAKHCPECGYEMSEAPTEEVMSEYDKRRCNYPNDI